MNYYEELGLNPSASPSEIRAAYKRVVRLLHPDQQHDEGLRRLAECQLKRLNEVYETLIDPARRRSYDLNCAGALGSLQRFRRHLRPATAALVLVLALAGLLAWRLPQSQPQTRAAAPFMAAGQAPSSEAQDQEVTPASVARLLRTEVAESRRELQRLRSERDAALRELELLRAATSRPAALISAPEAPPLQGHLPAPPPEQPPPVVTPASISPPSIPPAPSDQGMDGAWVYVPPRLNAGRPAGYTAEFVEVVIESRNGALRGRYRGRYRIPDRPISPDVSFQFQGPAGGDEAVVSWEGPGGAKGQMTLRLVSPDRLQIDWFATELGTQLGLASGSSLLTRRRIR